MRKPCVKPAVPPPSRQNESEAQLTGHLLANDQPSHGGRQDRSRPQILELISQSSSKLFDNRHLLQGQSTLKKLSAMQTTPEDEVAFEQAPVCSKSCRACS